MKEGYKMTELGNIPNEWRVDRLQDIAELIDGDRSSNYPSGDDIVPNGIVFLSTANIKNDRLVFEECRYITKEKFNSLKKGKLQDKDIIITLRGSLGNIGYFRANKFVTGLINAQMMIIRKSSDVINSDYLYKYMTSELIKNQIKSISTGSAQPQLTKKDMSTFKIVIPPLPEQQKIADILSTLDEQIDNVDRLIEKTKELKRGLMQQLLTKGIGHTEFKETEVGVIPKEWEVKKLGDIATVTKLAGFEFTQYIQYKDCGEIIALRALNLKNGKLDLNDIKKIDKDVSNNLLRSKLFQNDIVFSYVGTIGEVAIIEENDKYHLAPNVAKITAVQGEILTSFLLQYFMSDKIKSEINKLLTTTSQPALSMTNIRELRIIIPRIKEQQKIVELTSSLDKKIDEETVKKDKLQQLKKGLMQQLLTGKIRVKVEEM